MFKFTVLRNDLQTSTIRSISLLLIASFFFGVRKNFPCAYTLSSPFPRILCSIFTAYVSLLLPKYSVQILIVMNWGLELAIISSTEVTMRAYCIFDEKFWVKRCMCIRLVKGPRELTTVEIE